jgi:hypothetical protein
VIASPAGVALELRESCNTELPATPKSINMLLVTAAPGYDCEDCDLFDKGAHYTKEFRAGAPLNAKGDGLFDFYIYNRYKPDADLAGNVLVAVKSGKMDAIWIEGGNSWSWTPGTGVVSRSLAR